MATTSEIPGTEPLPYREFKMKRFDAALSACLSEENEKYLESACLCALTAGKILHDLYDTPHTIKMKGTINLVTEADVAAEAAIIDILQKKYPTHQILAEESAQELNLASSGKVWVIDPLDGTTNFAHGFPHFAVSVALVEKGQPRVGAIYNPMMDELFSCSVGGGAWCNQNKLKVTETELLLEALIGTGFPYNIEETVSEILPQLEAVVVQVRDIRRAGAAALDLAYVAAGRLDGFYEQGLQPWDTAAGWLLVQEAGGRVTDYAGLPYSCQKPEILASNGHLHNKLNQLI